MTEKLFVVVEKVEVVLERLEFVAAVVESFVSRTRTTRKSKATTGRIARKE